MTEPRRQTVRHLAHRIKGAGQQPFPRFCFFLGAGASFQSGIPLAGSMIADFSKRLIEEQCPPDCVDAKQQQAWLEEQSWYAKAKAEGSLYSALFEMHERKERGRQLYIEQMIEGKKPSFGYVVLANLMARNYVNTVLTTNFDDLVYNACSTFTDIRPAVYAYGTMISDLRITNARPKILKLHGDYLYSKLKNSAGELSQQDPNMSRYVSILLNEYGLIVAGYSGCDSSIMDMLRKFPPDNDLYWCGRAGSPMPESVRTLLLETNGSYVEIEGFDQMMNEIRSVVGFDVPRMLGSLEARQDEMIEQLKTFPISVSGMSALLREVYDFRQKDAAERQQKSQKEEAFLHYINALDAWNNFNFTKAEDDFKASLALNTEDVNARIALACVLCQEGKYKESEEEIQKARALAAGDNLSKAIFQLAYLYMVQGRHSEASVEFREVIRLDPKNSAAHNGLGVACMALKRYEEAAASLRTAASLDSTTYYPAFNLACVLAVQGDVAEARTWWNKARSLWQGQDHIDRYNLAIIDAYLGDTDTALEELRTAIADGQPGLAALALESVTILESATRPIAVLTKFRELLEKASSRSVSATQT